MNLCFRNIYNHADPIAPVGEHSMTDEQFAEECDINCILKRYKITGQLPIRDGTPVFADVSEIGDYSAVMSKIKRANDYFDELPSDIRARFGNDQRAFYEFVMNPANADECVKLGVREIVQPSEDAVSVLKEIKEIVTPKGETAAK